MIRVYFFYLLIFLTKKILVLLSASVERFGVSRMLDFNLSKYSDMLVFMQNQKDSQALKYGLVISNALIRQPGDLAVLIVSIYNFTLNCLWNLDICKQLEKVFMFCFSEVGDKIVTNIILRIKYKHIYNRQMLLFFHYIGRRCTDLPFVL